MNIYAHIAQKNIKNGLMKKVKVNSFKKEKPLMGLYLLELQQFISFQLLVIITIFNSFHLFQVLQHIILKS